MAKPNYCCIKYDFISLYHIFLFIKVNCFLQVFAVVEKAGTVVMNDGEELDSWSVLINGHVEVEHANGHIEHLQMGDR